MGYEQEQLKSPEQAPKLSDRYDTLIQKLSNSKDIELLKPLIGLNEEVLSFVNRPYETPNNLSDDKIKEYQYIMGKRFEDTCDWIGFITDNINKIQSVKVEDDVSELWEKMIKYVKLTSKSLKDLKL